MSAAERLTVEFAFTGTGWLDIRLARGRDSYVLEGLSYLTPVLDDVLAMALSVATGEQYAAASFELEPGTLRLVCKTRNGRTSLAVLESESSAFSRRRDDECSIEWGTALDGPCEFAYAVLAGARALEAAHGHDGYVDKWVENPFPVRAVAALGKALNAV